MLRHDAALELVIETIPTMRRVVARLRAVDRSLADQLRRAVTSVALNLAEADGNRDGNRRLRLETAHGSVQEAKIALRVAIAWGYVSHPEVTPAVAALDRVGAMTWRRLRAGSRP